MSPHTTPLRTRKRISGSTSSMFTAESADSASSAGMGSPTVSVDRPDGEVAVGLADPSNTGSRKAMLQLINRLRDTGVQTDIDLPMIAVIGNQSAGKSSLIESISGITLPRSAGTCTRCPTECKLSHSLSPWQCLVKLHFTTDANGVPIPVKIVSFGGPITSKAHVEDRIRRAQRAILNPSKNHSMYLNQPMDDLPDENEVSFSKNYVSLEISGPELTDLSFVDLPGLIASVGTGGNTRDIELVKSLITTYIEKPSCVILLTVACETDFENQGAHHLTKQYDPEGKRTVGVLTKPDRIEPGTESSWLRILRNEAEPLLNNWYCVKQPSPQDVLNGITWSEARKQENEWFSSTQPWASLESQYQRYLRSTFLTERLSLILSELIAKRLPKIHEELTNAMRETETKMRALPRAPSTNPIGDVLDALDKFVKDIGCRVNGTPGEEGLLQTIRPHQTAFKWAIRETAPNFVPWVSTTSKVLPKAEFLADDDGDDDGDDDSDDDGDYDSDDDGDDDAPEMEYQRIIYVDEVLKRAEKSCLRELPGSYPFIIQQDYIKEITAKWTGPAMMFFDQVYDILKADLARLVATHFEHMGNGNAKQAILMIVNDHLDEAADRTKERIQWLLDLEKIPMTLNTHYFTDYKDKFLTYYKASRDESELVVKLNRDRHMYAGPINQILADLNQFGIPAQANDLPRLLPPDPTDPALNIMASVRAYFQVAYKRIVDMIPMAIDYEIVRGVQRGIDKALREGLQVTGSDAHNRCKNMLEEQIHVASARRETQEKLQRLQAAHQELRRLI